MRKLRESSSFSEKRSSRWSFTMSTKYGASLFPRPPGTTCSGARFASLACLRRDVAVRDHLSEHAIARLHGPLGMLVRRGVAVRRADDARQKRRLAERNVVNVVIEVCQRALGKTVDPKAAAVAQINLVGVELENLLLGKAVLEFERHHGFGQFPPPGALRAEEEAARQLHRQRAGALGPSVVPQIGPSGAHDANQIETRMLEKTLVLGRKQGLLQYFGNVFKADASPLFARAVEKVGQELRFDLRAGPGRSHRPRDAGFVCCGRRTAPAAHSSRPK